MERINELFIELEKEVNHYVEKIAKELKMNSFNYGEILNKINQLKTLNAYEIRNKELSLMVYGKLKIFFKNEMNDLQITYRS